MNTDHVVHPAGTSIYLSANDGHLYRAPIDGGSATCVTRAGSNDGRMHFLHGIRGDGQRLTSVALMYEDGVLSPGRVFTMSANGDDYRAVSPAGTAADGPEYDPAGDGIYLNND